jgi:hypothetical protein
MTTRVDPLQQHGDIPDRVSYATGVLLNADDFDAEQLYHRGRLARVLAYLHGCGTVAGLRVDWQAAVVPSASDPGHEERLMVQPGLAIDRLGRIVEIPGPACIRLDPWFAAQTDSDLAQGLHGAPYNGVVVDVFVRFVVCERGKTPAFLTGPFDALNGLAPSRLRDSYELTLVIRKEVAPPLPQDPWPDLPAGADTATRLSAAHAAVFAAWQDSGENGVLPPSPEHVLGQDPTSLFLARLVLPATAPGPGVRPTRVTGAAVTVGNEHRLFVFSTAALARWIGLP